MRLWTLHPRYLDPKGLVAVWREALLAQKVLQDLTVGYKHHPQLQRFKAAEQPLGAIARYLRVLHEEALSRGYRFNADSILSADSKNLLVCTRGQLFYEWRHLKQKVKVRDPRRLMELEKISEPEAHPIFEIVEGDVETWERR